MMEIVEDFDEKSYNNNGKPWKYLRILLVKPHFFIFFTFHHFSSPFFSHFFVFFFFSFFVSFHFFHFSFVSLFSFFLHCFLFFILSFYHFVFFSSFFHVFSFCFFLHFLIFLVSFFHFFIFFIFDFFLFFFTGLIRFFCGLHFVTIFLNISLKKIHFLGPSRLFFLFFLVFLVFLFFLFVDSLLFFICFFLFQHLYQGSTKDVSSAVGSSRRCGVLTKKGGIAGIGLGRLLG